MAENKSSGIEQTALALLDEASRNTQAGSAPMARFQAEGIDDSPWNPVRVVMASGSSQAIEASKATQAAAKGDGGSTVATQGSGK